MEPVTHYLGGAGRDQWTDPRESPKPPSPPSPRPLAVSPDDLVNLVSLCRSGRIYAVEVWIKDGKPIQVEPPPRGPRKSTPLQVAIDAKFHDLVLLLLSNGYRPDLEPEPPLDRVLRLRAWDLLELLLTWGADPTRVDPETVLDTYQSDLMERFWSFGVDYTRDHVLAHYLTSSTRNRPAYGWARRHRDDPRIGRDLAMALGEAIWDDNEKAVSLLLWAGADPHRRVPTLRWSSPEEEDDEELLGTAVEAAVHAGKGHLIRFLKPDPQRDDFGALWSAVHDPESVDRLAAINPPTDWSPSIINCINRLSYRFLAGSDWPTKHCLERISDQHGGSLSTLAGKDCVDLRRSMFRIRDSYDFRWLLDWLRKPRHCDPAIYADLTRTSAMQARLTAAGLVRKPIVAKAKPRRRS